ncbi:MAG: preprotein translocase subunit SecG [Endomicrobium sp.]|jgi:protein translocase SecG subunit|nr:preprotein translocase subunit SecG [Endomicrobium sp.]
MFLFVILKMAHYFLCILLSFLIFLQIGNYGGIAGFFNKSSYQIFDISSGMTVTKKLTIVLSVSFLISSFVLAKIY